MSIKDSGHRTEYETGAVRDARPGRGRCDLLPLTVLADGLGYPILDDIERYIRTGHQHYLWSAWVAFVSESQLGSYEDALLEVAIHYEQGARKYKPRNWEQGIPLHTYIDSAVRHYLKHKRGDQDERHDRAFLWNLLCAMWTQDNLPAMIDLPFADKEV